jgi:acetoacetyl-CoA synthetase
MATAKKMWEASELRQEESQMAAFAVFAHEKTGRVFSNWQELYQWSISELNEFWGCLAAFCRVMWQDKPELAYANPRAGMRTAQWFSGGQLNFAENILPAPSDREVLTCNYENKQRITLSAGDLHRQVMQLRAALAARGIKKGDYLAGVLCNGSEAIITMLAGAALGAVWCGVSPDFGAPAIMDRLQQIKPAYIFFSQGYFYNGVYVDCREKMQRCLQELGSDCRGILVPYPGVADEVVAGWEPFSALLDEGNALVGSSPASQFTPLSFTHPLYVLFTSGTTGKPKGIVHGAGGTLLQHKKELMLHCDISAKDRFLFYTTTSWMMWHWMVSSLATGCALVTYDGSPAYPGTRYLWLLAAAEELTVLGTSPKFLSTCIKAGTAPSNFANFASLRTLLCTGAPLLPHHYEWVYTQVKADLHCASISGGTDIISCFMLGNPLLPVYAGEIQCPGLGMAIAARKSESPARLRAEGGELICSAPFVSMPVRMLNDHDASLYRQTYFDYFSDEEVWHHGDFVEFTPRGGVIVHGRSDAVLNPGGVRIGTSELYGQLEKLPEIADALAVGIPQQDDSSIVLFVRLVPEAVLDSGLQARIKRQLKEGLSPRHVPRKIIQVAKIPYTRNGKKMERAVLNALQGQPLSNLSAMEDPTQLDEYVKMANAISSSS